MLHNIMFMQKGCTFMCACEADSEQCDNSGVTEEHVPDENASDEEDMWHWSFLLKKIVESRVEVKSLDKDWCWVEWSMKFDTDL